MHHVRCLSSNSSWQLLEFKCIMTAAWVQMHQVSCLSSNLSWQLLKFKFIMAAAWVQMHQVSCLSSNLSWQLLEFKCIKSAAWVQIFFCQLICSNASCQLLHYNLHTKSSQLHQRHILILVSAHRNQSGTLDAQELVLYEAYRLIAFQKLHMRPGGSGPFQGSSW